MTEADDNGKNVKIGIVSILTLAAVILGFFFVAVLNHEARISKTEANQEYVVKSVDEIKCSLKELNNKLDGIKK
jgi:flagellar basal body-associated protein FliL